MSKGLYTVVYNKNIPVVEDAEENAHYEARDDVDIKRELMSATFFPDGRGYINGFNATGERQAVRIVRKLQEQGVKALKDWELSLIVQYAIETCNAAERAGLKYQLTQEIYDEWYFRSVPDNCICSHPLYHGGFERVRLPANNCPAHGG